MNLAKFCKLSYRDEFLVAPEAAADFRDVPHVVRMDCHSDKKPHHEQRARGEVSEHVKHQIFPKMLSFSINMSFLILEP